MLEDVVKNDVAAKMPPSQGEIERAQALRSDAEQAVQDAPPALEDTERAERQARIFARRMAKTLKGMTGDDVTPDEAEEIAEIGGALFRGLLRIPFGSALGGMIVAICVAVPFIPRILKFTAKKEETNTNAV